MIQISLEGKPCAVKGPLPTFNEKAEDFKFVRDDLSEAKFSDYRDKVRVIIALPSLDTDVCATEAHNFNGYLAKKAEVAGFVVSKDLPFAMKRFYETNGVANVINASDFRYGDFSGKYNLEILDGPFKGLAARAVFVVDKDDRVHYSELVNDLCEEPDYEKTMAAVDELLKK